MSAAQVKALKELMLGPPRWTLAAAESLTCGHVQAQVGAISGASKFFLGGVTAYTLEEKTKLLGVARAEAKRVNCVSARVAEEMACGACRLFGSDFGVATTGYAEPFLDDAVTVPLAFWAIAHDRGRGGGMTVRSGYLECSGAKRVEVQRVVAQAVLAELVELLRGLRAGAKR